MYEEVATGKLTSSQVLRAVNVGPPQRSAQVFRCEVHH